MQDKDVAAGGETPPARIPDQIASLLQKFVAENINDGAVLTDWFIAFGAMQQSDDSPSGISFARRYMTSDSSPQGAVGIAVMGINDLQSDLDGGCSHCSCNDD